MERGLSDDQYDHFWQNAHFPALSTALVMSALMSMRALCILGVQDAHTWSEASVMTNEINSGKMRTFPHSLLH